MFINNLGEFIICRCFLKLDSVSTRLAPNRLLEIGSFRGVIMAKIKLTKSAVDATQAQAQAAAQDRERETDLCMPGQSERRP